MENTFSTWHFDSRFETNVFFFYKARSKQDLL